LCLPGVREGRRKAVVIEGVFVAFTMCSEKMRDGGLGELAPLIIVWREEEEEEEEAKKVVLRVVFSLVLVRKKRLSGAPQAGGIIVLDLPYGTRRILASLSERRRSFLTQQQQIRRLFHVQTQTPRRGLPCSMKKNMQIRAGTGVGARESQKMKAA
jgi:hypothetical protein